MVPPPAMSTKEATSVGRPGAFACAFAIYIEPWHAEVFEFFDLRKNHGKGEVRTSDLFRGLWIPDVL